MSEQNKETARKYIQDLWDKGDMSAGDELITADFVNHSPFPGLPPDREGMKAEASVLLRALRGGFTIDDLISEGDKVAIRLTYRGTHVGEFKGIAATGNEVEFEGIVVLRIRDNQIVERWAVIDSLAMMQQIGAIPSSG